MLGEAWNILENCLLHKTSIQLHQLSMQLIKSYEKVNFVQSMQFNVSGFNKYTKNGSFTLQESQRYFHKIDIIEK